MRHCFKGAFMGRVLVALRRIASQDKWDNINLHFFGPLNS